MINAKQFALAGNATFTVVSKRSGQRFTFKVRQPSETAPHFVSLLSGPDNENDFQFLGTIFPDGNFRIGKKSRITPEAPSAKAFAWLWTHIDNNPIQIQGQTVNPLDLIELHHEGRCCRCGRKLTVPESIESGIGPECATKTGF